MKKFFVLTALLFLIVPFFALAAVTDPSLQQVSGGGFAQGDLGTIIGRILKWALGFLLVIAVGAFVISGILYVTAGGEEGRIKTAKTIMIFAIVGVIVGLIGYVAIQTVQGLLVQ
jgi:hypothetical protein